MSASAMATLPAHLRDVIETLNDTQDSEERAALLIHWADRYRPVDRSIAQHPYDPSHRIPYCESDAYVWAIRKGDGTMDLHFAVENPSGISAKALAAILKETLSGLPAAAVAAVPPDIVLEIFRQNISMGKGMGLMAMVQAVQALARNAELPGR
jgi:cysteine desulfuration protein SufE